jgi:hypothetical protein
MVLNRLEAISRPCAGLQIPTLAFLTGIVIKLCPPLLETLCLMETASPRCFKLARKGFGHRNVWLAICI